MKFQLFRSSILAGIYIGIASLMYIKIGGVVGACLFSFGLVAVVCFRACLYTGIAGFIYSWREIKDLIIILLGNVIGCLGVAALALYSLPGISDSAVSVVSSRLEKEWWQGILLGIGCGFLMTTAVSSLKPWVEKKNWLPLFLSVPMFILCGFLHSIADSFYFLACGWDWLKENYLQVLEIWGCVVFGNFIGCNLPRFIIKGFGYGEL